MKIILLMFIASCNCIHNFDADFRDILCRYKSDVSQKNAVMSALLTNLEDPDCFKNKAHKRLIPEDSVTIGKSSFLPLWDQIPTNLESKPGLMYDGNTLHRSKSSYMRRKRQVEKRVVAKELTIKGYAPKKDKKKSDSIGGDEGLSVRINEPLPMSENKGSDTEKKNNEDNGNITTGNGTDNKIKGTKTNQKGQKRPVSMVADESTILNILKGMIGNPLDKTSDQKASNFFVGGNINVKRTSSF